MARANQGLSAAINVAITPELKAELTTEARDQGLEFSTLVRQLIASALHGKSEQPSMGTADQEAVQARYQHADNLQAQRNLELMLENALATNPNVQAKLGQR